MNHSSRYVTSQRQKSLDARVVARHVDQLKFIDVMLGDKPALTPQQTAYQRMLTGDPIEAIEQARSFLKAGSVQDYYDEILLGALRLAEADAKLGRLDENRLQNIHRTVSEIIDDLAAYDAPDDLARRGRSAGKGKSADVESGPPAHLICCIPGLGWLDDCAALVVADVLKRHGMVARTASAATATEADHAETICVCFLEQVTDARTDFTRRKVSRQASAAKVVVALLGQSNVIRDGEPRDGDLAPRSLQDVLSTMRKLQEPRVFGNNRAELEVQAAAEHSAN